MSFKDIALAELTALSAELFALPDVAVDDGDAQRTFNAVMAAMSLGATADEVEAALMKGLEP